MSHPTQFYVKVAVASFIVGGCMELFMIKTGFYDKVTEIESQRLEETRDEREAFRKMLKEEVEKQAKEKHLNLNLDDK